MRFHPGILLILPLGLLLVASAAVDPPNLANPRWLDKLDTADRMLIEENIGFAPPRMTDDLSWLAGKQLTWDQLIGKVVIVQSWTTKTAAGRSAPQRTQRAVASFPSNEVVVIALHTPEGAENARTMLEKRDLGMPVLLDSKGRFCDEFGFYKRAANIVIDRNGLVRFAGLTPLGLKEAVAQLLEETRDEAVKPEPRPRKEADTSDIAFPPVNTGRISARDLQGQRAPDMFVQQWLNGRPDATNKLVVIDFWATWCGPCKEAVPHMNDLARAYRRDVVAVGLSDEPPATVQNFLRQNTMNYAVAVDPSARMKNAFAVTGIPHLAIISSDWIVRWQGHPVNLTDALVRQLVEANRALAGSQTVDRYRWTGANGSS